MLKITGGISNEAQKVELKAGRPAYRDRVFTSDDIELIRRALDVGATVDKAGNVELAQGGFGAWPRVPDNAADAVAMLRQLSGRRHQVLTALVLHDPASGQRQSACSVSDVWFDTLDDARIDAYVATGEPFGKAGGYGIQGRAATWVARIEGSFSGIVGLPLFELDQLLRADRAGRAGGPG